MYFWGKDIVTMDLLYYQAYLLDSIDLWHARLGHVSISYIKKINTLGLISSSNCSSMNKCEVCVEAKISKKTCTSVKREIDLA